MNEFKDLVFLPHRVDPNGLQAVMNFDNGYGVSVIRFHGSYGNETGLWELAVLKNDKLCYETPITGDVLGYLTEEEVTETMRQVQELPSADCSGDCDNCSTC